MPGGGFANPDQDKDDLINDRDVIYTIGIVLVQKIRAAVFILFVCSLTMGYPNTFSNAFGQMFIVVRFEYFFQVWELVPLG